MKAPTTMGEENDRMARRLLWIMCAAIMVAALVFRFEVPFKEAAAGVCLLVAVLAGLLMSVAGRP